MWADKFPPNSRKIIEDARRVTIHPDVMSMALTLVEQGEDKVKKVAPYVVFPDYETWIEGEIEADEGLIRWGCFFTGSDKWYNKKFEKDWSVESGDGFLALANHPDKMEDPDIIHVGFKLKECRLDHLNLTPMLRDIEAEAPWHLKNDPSFREALTQALAGEKDPIALATGTAPARKVFAPILVAILALMNSPKLVRTKQHTMEKFNARRIKRGKYPYFPHHEVYLNVDKHAFEVQQGQGDGPERCLHFVRAHPRFYVHPRYKEASVTIVQPHWRGNPELGIKNSRYNMGREKSVWPDRNPG